MLREVHRVGTLVADEVLWIPAIADGRETKINVYPGAVVDPDTVLMELDKSQMEPFLVRIAQRKVEGGVEGQRDGSQGYRGGAAGRTALPAFPK